MRDPSRHNDKCIRDAFPDLPRIRRAADWVPDGNVDAEELERRQANVATVR
jgi:hypothetical protein